MQPKRQRLSGRPSRPPQQASESRLRAAWRAPTGSGQRPLLYAMVQEILNRYLSPVLVSSVLEKAMKARHVTPSTVGPSSLAEITSDIMLGLRMFVPEDLLPQLMLELAEVLVGGQT